MTRDVTRRQGQTAQDAAPLNIEQLLHLPAGPRQEHRRWSQLPQASSFTRQALFTLSDSTITDQVKMSAQDMRDMLGLTGDAARPPPLKKQKTVEKRQRASHSSITQCAAC
jgi:hypothetical protein